jgi:replicative DNA helicase
VKQIFRSIIDIPNKDGKPTIEQAELVLNYRAFTNSNIQPEDPSYIKLYHMIEAHYRDYKEVPSVRLINQKAEKDGDEGVLASLKDIVQEKPFVRSNYLALLKEKFEAQCKDNLQQVIQKVWEAANNGIKIGKKEVKGIGPAVEYFIAESRRFRMGDLSIKTEGNIRSIEDSQEVRDLYKKRKENPLAHVGMYTFLDRIDNSCRGLKPGELMMVAAYVKQGKTILTTNLAYNGIVQGLNGLFVTLEMSFEEMRDMVYVLHSCNPDWMENPKYKNLIGKVTYDKVTYGELSDTEQDFYGLVTRDFSSRGEDFGNLFLYQPTENLTPSKLEMLAYDYNARLTDVGKHLDFLIVDYVGLMYPDKSDHYGDFNVDLNGIIKKLKNLALNFDNGRKIRVISPFQINRTGHKEAEKNDGQYKLSALSNANEAERSSDLIISTYFSDEMKKAGLMKICCMAHRKGAGFDPFEAHLDFGTRQVKDIIQKSKADAMDKETAIQYIPLDA